LTVSSVARETVRELAGAPSGRRVVDLERRLGQPTEVVRTLNRLQQEGLVEIHVDPTSMELTVRPTAAGAGPLKDLDRRLS
jgi:hypothetical protein